MAWYDVYERDVLGKPGPAGSDHPTRPVSVEPKSDPGISPSPALTTPVQPSTPPKRRRLDIDAGTAVGELVSGFIESLLEFFLGRR
ncbi:hypothetical protein [Nocardia asiatica]|uniref:hypothetical protein n=1 Tax=Nocardia asiatica TaxID=209252 RepID=UPI002457B73C|nr:hypothetical protein [Nocardia asiatica]